MNCYSLVDRPSGRLPLSLDTIAEMWRDHLDGVLRRPVAEPDDLRNLLEDRGVQAIDWSGWRAIDAAERERGTSLSRPRVKFIGIPEMRTAALGAPQ